MDSKARKDLTFAGGPPNCAKCPLNVDGPQLCSPISRRSKLLIILDAPDYTDREEGRLCGGRVGRLMSGLWRRAGLERSDITFTAALQCVPTGTESDGDMRKAVECCRPRLLEELRHYSQGAARPTLVAGKWAAQSVTRKRNVLKWMGARQDGVDGLENLKCRVTWALPSLFFNRGEGKIRAVANHLMWAAHPEIDDRIPVTAFIHENDESRAALQRWINAPKGTILGLDIETSSGTMAECGITCIGISDKAHAVSLEWPLSPDFLVLVQRLMRTENITWVLHNGAFDRPILERHGFPPLPGGRVHDTLIMHSVVQPLGFHGLGPAIAAEFPWRRWKTEFKDDEDEVDGATFWTTVDPVARREYNAIDAYASVRLWEVLQRDIGHNDFEVYLTRLAVDRVAATMRQDGVIVDPDVRSWMKNGAESLRGNAEKACRLIAGAMEMPDINLRSPKQLNTLFHSKFGLRPFKTSEKTGEASLDEWVLQQIAELGGAPALMAKALMEYREHDKVISTFLDGCPVGPDNKARFDWKVWATVTGRWASSPNAQNYPKHLRAMFRARPGCVILGPDYKQLEVRIIAQQAGVRKLLDAFERGDDIYKIAAKDLFALESLDAVTDAQRKAAKQFVLGGNYGGGSETLWEQMSKKGFKIPWADVDLLLKRYLEVFAPEIPQWHKRVVREAKAAGWVAEPWTGVRRPVRPWTKPTEIVNFPVQSMAGSIANAAMLKLNDTRHPDDRILFQVHDEITVEGPDAARLEKWVQDCMPATIRLNGIVMRYDIDIKSGPYWGTME